MKIPNDESFDERQMRVVIVGVTGMVGGYAPRQMLKREPNGQVTAIVRQELGIPDAKLKNVLIRDLSNCSEIARDLSGQNGAIFCLGAYTGAASDEEL